MKLSALNKRNYSKRNLLIAATFLYAISFLSSFFFQKQPSVSLEKHRLEKFISVREKKYEALVKDSALMRKLVLHEESLQEFEKLAKIDFGVFVFAQTLSDESDLLFWNDQKILPPTVDYSLPDGEYFQQLANGYYFIVKKTITLSGMSNNIAAYALIPILYKYRETKYLVTHFTYDESAHKRVKISNEKTRYIVHSLHGKPLFYLNKTGARPPTSDAITISLRITAFL